MVKIIYDFNDAAIARAGTTKDELLKKINSIEKLDKHRLIGRQ